MKNIERSIRLDLLIAVCALLISSLAMAASWLQSRETARQTQVLEEQLGAQVWPYIGVSVGLDETGNAATITVENDGLGPAVLYGLSATVDGKPEATFIDVLHAILGPHIAERKPHGEHMGFDLNNESVGGVLRPGESDVLLRLDSKHFAHQFVYAYKRISVRICYCAIIPGKCWRNDTTGDAPPQPIAACPVVPGDMLHTFALPDTKLL